MKKTIILAVLALASTAASAQHYHGYGGENRWVPPLIIGGIIGYAIRQNQPVQQPQQPVIIYQERQPVYTPPQSHQVPQHMPQTYQLPPPRPVYKEVSEFDVSCQCYTQVVRQVGWQ